MKLIPREVIPSLKRVASVFANEQNKSSKSDKDSSNEFDEKTLEEYAETETPRV